MNSYQSGREWICMFVFCIQRSCLLHMQRACLIQLSPDKEVPLLPFGQYEFMAAFPMEKCRYEQGAPRKVAPRDSSAINGESGGREGGADI